MHVFCSVQDARKVLEIVRHLRKKGLQKLDKRSGDLKYLCSMGLDAKDAKLQKEAGHIENRIAMWDVKLTTAKFLQNKVRYYAPCVFAALSINQSFRPIRHRNIVHAK